MGKPILAVVAALFVLSLPVSANGLESVANCDDDDDSLEQTVVDEGTPAPDPSPAPGV